MGRKTTENRGDKGVLTKRKNGISIIHTGTNNDLMRTELL